MIEPYSHLVNPSPSGRSAYATSAVADRATEPVGSGSPAPSPQADAGEEPDFAYMNEAAQRIEAEEIARLELKQKNEKARAEAKRQGVTLHPKLQADAGEVERGIKELIAGNDGKSVYVATDWLAEILSLIERQAAQAKSDGEFITAQTLRLDAALDKIERQAVEIAKLEGEHDGYEIALQQAQAEIERLRIERDRARACLDKWDGNAVRTARIASLEAERERLREAIRGAAWELETGRIQNTAEEIGASLRAALAGSNEK